jgi:glycosyltransferase involved in cell wall biosynthesis
LSEYKPELLYLQVSSREEIEFAKVLINYLKIPSVIHMMDDWPTTISNKGIFKNFWQKKIDLEFKQLLNQVDLHLSISDAMSEEYLRRYNKIFTAFHNPIDTDIWLPFCKSDFVLDNDHIKILYSGRIGMGITESLYEVASAIDLMNNKESKIKFHIQTPSKSPEILNRLRSYKCVVINPFADYDELPKIFSEADILVLANDFDKSGMDFLRYSMPTKASEFMISGTPILIYAPIDSAVSTFFIKNECGYFVSGQSSDEIIKGIKFLIGNEEYRRKISRSAVAIAQNKFSTTKVRNEFQQLLINLKENINN